MSATRIVGLILVIVGLVGLLWGGVFWNRERTIVDIGPIEAKAQEREGVPISPIIGGLILVAGIVLMVVPGRRKG